MREALAFLTPFGGARAPTHATMRWFPLLGAVLGLALGGIWWAAAELWPPAVAAAIVVACDLALTGMLHFDGLVDAADGLLPPLPRARRLEVMADPHAGAFGVGVGVAVLLLRWASMAAMEPSPLLLAGLWGASRSAMAVAARSVPYARDGGLAATFLGGRAHDGVVGVALLGTGVGGALAAAGRGWAGLVAWAALVAAMGAVVLLSRRRVGGFTGDVLGAAGVVGETVGLVVAAARW